MIVTDYLYSGKDISWDYARQCGVTHGTIRLPESNDFDITDRAHWQTIRGRFQNFGIQPIVIEPLPNILHDHIKTGDSMRDESIEKLIKAFQYMQEMGIHTVCFNFMAHIGWLRTSNEIHERGQALVTGFDLRNVESTPYSITEKELWDNYLYFIKAVLPFAEKYNIRLALHPDDPPLDRIGNVSRIMTSYPNIKKAIDTIRSDMLGVTMCQATYYLMGEDLFRVVPELADKIFFIHFRNVRGNKFQFQETFHDNGDLDMAALLRLYTSLKLDVPIRVDHVPLMAGERNDRPGYTVAGRLFAIGYLKGLLQMCEQG
ncbi:mannonate dehydratase [Marasmitruncus massiliensis]|uniref:mannonate dehydratase n=1 Tax=Marasmitruncus massiliensis TaxID=1944642 RepID=UPI000C7B291A|nr:mannonate dehydratase [Marasmitruncus massiliensis]